jgi:CDP-glucose 4,6-dehydratase
MTSDFLSAYRARRVLITGHTGFKGAWLAEWLLARGAEVFGFSLPEPPTTPSLFGQLALPARLAADTRGDVRDREAVAAAVRTAAPDIVFHLAAQPLVRLSYETPVETFETNVTGAANVLEAVRRFTAGNAAAHPVAVVVVTTDKCYENREWVHGYRETDPLGGHDPYSASKACEELVAASFRRSFFAPTAVPALPVALATARAGNVIGGGDWALDRIVPDCMRALAAGRRIRVRNPSATRPWQHVLDPLAGYLMLGAQLMENAALPPAERALPARARFEEAFNFGPAADSNRTVGALVSEVLRHWDGGAWEGAADAGAPHEANLLALATDKAHHLLHWRPVWDFAETVAQTVAWYRESAADGVDFAALTRRQIREYETALESTARGH